MSLDSFNSKRTLTAEGNDYAFFSIDAAAQDGAGEVARLPVSLKILLENLLRFEDAVTVTSDDIRALGDWVALPPDAPRPQAKRCGAGRGAGRELVIRG